MRILGLDLSLTSTGYVLLEEDQVIWFGSVGGGTLRGEARLAVFDAWIRAATAERFQPLSDRSVGMAPIDVVAIEGYSYGSPQGHTQAFSLGELGGIVKLAIHQAGIPLHIIPSGMWKKALCGNGSLNKTKATLELFKRYGVEFNKQDTVDAWAVAMCCRRQLLGLDKPETKKRSRKGLSARNPELVPANGG